MASLPKNTASNRPGLTLLKQKFEALIYSLANDIQIDLSTL